MYRVKVGDSLFPEASAPSKKAARQLAAEEAVKELMADGKLQLNRVRSQNNLSCLFGREELRVCTSEKKIGGFCLLGSIHISVFLLSPTFSVLQPQLPLGSSSDSDGSGYGTLCPSLPPLTADELRVAHEAGVGDLINHLNNNAVSGLLEYARARGFAAEIRLVGQSGPAHEPKYVQSALITQNKIYRNIDGMLRLFIPEKLHPH